MRVRMRRAVGDWAMGVLSRFPRFLRRHVPGGHLDWKTSDETRVATAPCNMVRLLIGPANFAGQGYEWARAAELLPQVSSVCLERTSPDARFAFEADHRVLVDVSDFSRHWGKKQRRAVSGFTHVLIEAGIPLYNAARREQLVSHVRELQASGLRVGLIWHGTDVRTPEIHAKLQPDSPLGDMTEEANLIISQRAQDNHQAADTLGVPEFVSTPDLLRFRPNATWLPTVSEYVPKDPDSLTSGQSPPVILHAPSQARVKGTKAIRAAAMKLEREGLAQYREVSGVPHSEVLSQIEEADIVIDSLGLGSYGVISIEAMLAGRVAVGNVWQSAREAIRERTGLEVPVVQVDTATIEGVLRDLVAFPARRRQLGREGRHYAHTVHSRKSASVALRPFLLPQQNASSVSGGIRAQIVIPVHDSSRPLRRAVESVLRCDAAGVIVVAHGLSAGDLDLPRSDRIVLLETSEGEGLPGVAFNVGLDAATAPWVGIMGSDDWYEDGGIDAMLSRLATDHSDGILAPIRQAQAPTSSLKPVTWRRTRLQAHRDRLFFRTAPLGLFRRELMQNPRYQMADHVVAGIDQLSSVRLWTDGLNISYHPEDPAYVVGDDARQRVTLTPRPLSVQAAMWQELWDDEGVLALPPHVKQALADKVIRVHVFDTIGARVGTRSWVLEDFAWLSGLAIRISTVVPNWAAGLSRAQTAVFESLVRGDRASTEDAWSVLKNTPGSLPARPQGLVHPNGPLRPQVAAAASSLRSRVEAMIGKNRVLSSACPQKNHALPSSTCGMIFHAPFPVRDGTTSASSIRPWKMLQAFRSLGYEVFVISGYASQRRSQFRELKRRVKLGWCPQFCYSEAATIPSSFTEPRHIPLILNLDRHIFSFLHKNGVPLGVFYRDVYWAFPEYVARVGKLTAAAMRCLYLREIDTFNRYADLVFLPTKQMSGFVPGLRTPVVALPPGGEAAKSEAQAGRVEGADDTLRLLYVGDVGGDHYGIDALLMAVRETEGTHLTICTRPESWARSAVEYGALLSDRVEVVHESGTRLKELYDESDVACLTMRPGIYRSFAAPMKLYEYLASGTPVIASVGTYAGDFVERNEAGWVVDFTCSAIASLLAALRDDPDEVEDKAKMARRAGARETWEARAQSVSETLLSCEERPSSRA